jgi:imidazolonepropionase-like amidohydrolase
MAARNLLAALIGVVAALLTSAWLTAAQTRPIAIVGGTVYTVTGAPIERGTIVIRDGLIESVGENVTIPADAERIDATGRWVTPGLVNVVTQLGIVEIPLSGGPTDESATGHADIAAAFRPWEAFNAASPLLAATRNDGITTIGIFPTNNLVAGQHALVDLVGGPAAAMLRKAPTAIVAQAQNAAAAGTASRAELIQKLRQLLEEARDWPDRRVAFDENRSRPLLAQPADYEALQPVINGELPLIVVVDRVTEIDAVLNLAADFGLRVILASASEAWQRTNVLAARQVPVIVGGIRNIPDTFDRLGTRDDNAALLSAAGVTVLIVSDSYGDGAHFNARNVRFEAGNAVGSGMNWDAALKAVTQAPAEVFGVADRIGTLAPGLDANVVVWSGDPFEFATRAEVVFIRGTRVDGPSRQDELMQRYRTLPPAYRR